MRDASQSKKRPIARRGGGGTACAHGSDVSPKRREGTPNNPILGYSHERSSRTGKGPNGQFFKGMPWGISGAT